VHEKLVHLERLLEQQDRRAPGDMATGKSPLGDK
jgi:hypothetical protein